MEVTHTLRQKLSPKTIRTTLWALAFLLATWLSTLIPPMQSPDEGSHINRSYMISRGDLLLQKIPAHLTEPIENEEVAAFIARARRQGGRAGGLIDQGLLKFSDGYMLLAGNAEKRLSEAEKDQLSQLAWTSKQRYYPLPGTGYYFPAIYAPQALGLALGQQLNWSIDHSYRMARVVALLACFALLWLACELIKPSPLVVAVLLLPMSVFQLVSPTIDGLTTSLAVLTISIFLRCADPAHRPAPVLSWGLAICIFLLVTSRTHLLPLLALPFYLAWQRPSRRDLYLGCLVTVAALGWVLFAMYSTNDPRIVRNHTTTELLWRYLMYPGTYFKVVYASLTDPELFTFYQQSFIGILGWLDTRLPGYFYPALWSGLGLCALVSVSVTTLREDWHARLLLAGAALASFGLIFLALLVTWTPHPATVVQGVQGRYFVVPMLLLGYAFQGSVSVHSPRRGALTKFIVTGFTFVSLLALIISLLSRYH